MSCPFLKIFNPASFATKMEAYGISIVEIDGVSVLTHNGSIIILISERFTQRYLVNLVGCPSIREGILVSVKAFYQQSITPSTTTQRTIMCPKVLYLSITRRK
ncbi:unnamed protein product [Debaryomyces tyrocola]|nr:unnamed protein product [Debaryomyces tyrocola]